MDSPSFSKAPWIDPRNGGGVAVGSEAEHVAGHTVGRIELKEPCPIMSLIV